MEEPEYLGVNHLVSAQNPVTSIDFWHISSNILTGFSNCLGFRAATFEMDGIATHLALRSSPGLLLVCSPPVEQQPNRSRPQTTSAFS